jgi:dolichyl-phosphate-mannose--protein O-mannosyl transferase
MVGLGAWGKRGGRMFIVAYAFLIALALIQVGAYADTLPQIMAVHFVAGGKANGFTDKHGFILFDLAFTFFMPGVFFIVSLIIEKLPTAINIPNKGYWMDKSRRDGAVTSLARGLRMLGLMLGLLLVAINQLVINANLVKPPHLDERGIWLFLGVFAFAFISFLVWMTVRFKIPGKK